MRELFDSDFWISLFSKTIIYTILFYLLLYIVAQITFRPYLFSFSYLFQLPQLFLLGSTILLVAFISALLDRKEIKKWNFLLSIEKEEDKNKIGGKKHGKK